MLQLRCAWKVEEVLQWMYLCTDAGFRPIIVTVSENQGLCYAKTKVYCRLRVRERSLRYGLWQHCYLTKQFDAEEVFSCEGKTIMAIKYRQWRIKGVVLTRWQMQTVQKSDQSTPLDYSSTTTDIITL